jgi:hypothetical protein
LRSGTALIHIDFGQGELTLSANERNLDLIGVWAGTDKSRLRHDYLRHYEPFLHRYRDKPVTILEIGVHTGASLDMWEAYFPNAEIVAIDISQDVLKYAKGCTKIHIGSQADGEFLATIGTQYRPDIIVDDGSHIPEHQIFSFENLIQYVKPNGIYIVEDVQVGKAEEYFSGLVRDVYRNGRPWGITTFSAIPQAFLFTKAPVDEVDGDYASLERIARGSRLQAEGLFFLAEYMHKRGSPSDEVLRLAGEASDLEPYNQWMHYFISQVHHASGDAESARSSAQLAVDWAMKISGAVAAPIQEHYDRLQRAEA